MVENRKDWKTKRDPLYRGDSAAGVNQPKPSANPSIVRHILYLDGAGRETPYLSMTEDEAVARRFARNDGRVYETTTAKLAKKNVLHVSRKSLLQLLKGKGKGDAQWPSAFEIMQARRYAEEHAEHLADFRKRAADTPDELRQVVSEIFD